MTPSKRRERVKKVKKCEGDCCCRCKFYARVTRHPWNDEPFKGSINNSFGWVCMMFPMTNNGEDKDPPAIFSDRGHGLCEMFTKKSKP